MPIRSCDIADGISIFLPIKIINPHTGKELRTEGLVDTGASSCAIPASMATILGHNLKSGRFGCVGTGNGDSESYGHTTTISVYHPLDSDSGVEIFIMENVVIDYMPCLPIVLLGVDGFLSKFLLSIDYPNKKFSMVKGR